MLQSLLPYRSFLPVFNFIKLFFIDGGLVCKVGAHMGGGVCFQPPLPQSLVENKYIVFTYSYALPVVKY